MNTNTQALTTSPEQGTIYIPFCTGCFNRDWDAVERADALGKSILWIDYPECDDCANTECTCCMSCASGCEDCS